MTNTTTLQTDVELENVPCAVCGLDDARLLFVKAGFKIVSCRCCGLSYTNPRVRTERLADLYSAHYFKSDNSLVHGYVDYLKEKPAIRKTFKERWDLMKKHSPVDVGRVLDIGCALGFLLEIAQDEGWKVAGLDISEHAVAYARDVSKLPVQKSNLRKLPFPDGSFDVIAMWDVIEHVPDPVNLLRECSLKIKRGGLLSIITPDQASWPAKLFGRKWVEYEKPDEHLFFFSHHTLGKMLLKEGFQLLWRGTAGKHVPLGFALERLQAYHKGLFGMMLKIARGIGLDKQNLKINPFDKMFVLARKI